MQAFRLPVVILATALGVAPLAAQSVSGRFLLVSTGTEATITIQLRASAPVDLGNCSLRFTYNDIALAFRTATEVGERLDLDDLNWHNFQGVSASPFYLYDSSVTLSQPGELSVNIVLASTGSGQTLPDAWSDVVGIRLRIVDLYATSKLTWSLTEVYGEDNLTALTIGDFTGSDESLLAALSIPTEEPGSNDLAVTALYPNPARQFVSLVLTLDEATPVHVRLLDLLGRATGVTWMESGSAGRRIFLLDLKGIPPGSYTIEATAGVKSVRRQITVVS